MKVFIPITAFIIGGALVLTGCNGDVFINEFVPSVTELSMDGNGDSATVHFEGTNWEYLAVYPENNYDVPYEVRVYDSEGVSVGNDPYLKGLGKVVYGKEGTVDFAVERTASDELEVTVGENIYLKVFEFTIIASNKYESKSIKVTVLPCDRYESDGITYSLDNYLYDEPLEIKDKITVRNKGNTDVTYIIHPYENEYRSIEFTCDNQMLYGLLESKPMVDIPTMVGSSLKMIGERIQYRLPFDNAYQPEKLPVPEKAEKKIIIPPHTTKEIIVGIQYEWFETDYTLYLVQLKTGKRRTITGSLRSKTPKEFVIASQTYPLND